MGSVGSQEGPRGQKPWPCSVCEYLGTGFMVQLTALEAAAGGWWRGRVQGSILRDRWPGHGLSDPRCPQTQCVCVWSGGGEQIRVA